MVEKTFNEFSKNLKVVIENYKLYASSFHTSLGSNNLVSVGLGKNDIYSMEFAVDNQHIRGEFSYSSDN
jgi:hypothetical protein